MSDYLVIAHQTASSPELIIGLTDLCQSDPEARFVLVVPETPVIELEGAREGDSWLISSQVALEARADLEAAGLTVLEARVGDRSPLKAAEAEFRHGARAYQGAVVCTFPPGISRWLGLDLPRQLERKLSVPVSHIVANRARVSV